MHGSKAYVSKEERENITMQVNERFINYIGDWDYKTYLCIGGYGSSKSYNTALKLVLKLMQEKRKALVVRQVKDTHRDSTFALFKEILQKLEIITYDHDCIGKRNGCIQVNQNPMKINFPNGSEIIFRGCDNPEKLKSIHGVSIVWLEEASEISYAVYKELRKRLRTYDAQVHFLLSCNPVSKDNWVYQHFFKRITIDETGKRTERTICDDEMLYTMRTLVIKGVYYHHSVASDNHFLPADYLEELQSTKEYDADLYRIAWLGRFGVKGKKVLPQFEVAKDARAFTDAVRSIPRSFKFVGMDFGFVESFNAVVKVAVDDANKILYIYDEPLYINDITDDKTIKLESMVELRDAQEMICADSAEPKTIKFYRQSGFQMRACKKYAGSRLANVKKVKRFKKIVCSPKCTNVIAELKDLVYKVDEKTGKTKYDEFNIDPHTFSAIWYALDTYDVADVKNHGTNSQEGR